MKSLSSIEVAAVVKELQELVSSKVSQVYQPSKEEILIEFFKTSTGKFLVRVVPGRCLYVTSFKRKNPATQLGFCKFLRKRLTNVRLTKIEQKHFERIVEFTFETKEDKFYLIAELFSKGNIVFCDKEYKIVSAMQPQVWKDRAVKQGETYKYPPTSNVDIFNVTEMDFTDIVKRSDKDSIVKTLAMDIGLGGLYAEEICLRAGMDKGRKALKDPEISRIFNEVKKLARLDIKANIVRDEVVPFDMMQFRDKEAQPIESFNEAMDKYYARFIDEEEDDAKEEEFKKRMKELQTILKSQEAQLAEFENASKFSKEKGDLIYSNYPFVKEVFDVIKKAREKKIPWEEIEEKLKQKGIMVNGKEGKVTLELE